MLDAEVDGETFIGMDLIDIHDLTPKLRLRKLLRLAWTEVTGMVRISKCKFWHTKITASK